MDLTIFTFEHLKNSNSTFMAITALRSADVGVSTASQILEHHFPARTDKRWSTVAPDLHLVS